MRRVIISTIVGLGVFLFLSYKLAGTASFGGDFARDMYDLLTMAQGKLMLIGPKLSFGGIYTGPYYYFLLLPVYILSGLSIESVVMWNAALFGIGASFMYLLLTSKLVNLKWDLSILYIVYLFTLPLTIVAGRNPSNAYSYIPLLILTSTLILFCKLQRPITLLLTGFSMGVMMNFHLATVVVFIPLILFIINNLKRKQFVFFLLLGIIVAYVPLITFELKHNFVMFKNTFIDKSYEAFTNNKNLPGSVAPKANVFVNMLFLVPFIQEWMVINPFVLMGCVLLIVILFRQSKWIILVPLVSFFLLSLTLRFQFASHYLYPFSLLLVMSFAYILVKSKLWPVLGVLIVLNMVKAPNYFFGKTNRTPKKIEKQIEFLFQKRLVNRNESFNVLLLRKDTGLTPVGHEYRYFLRKNGYIPESEFAYKESKKLIIVSEFKNLDLKNIQSWEAKEFGTNYILKSRKYTLPDITFFIASK